MSTAPIDLVREFCAAFGDGEPDLDRIVGFFADDAVYHNMPVDPVVGPDAIRSTLASFTTGLESIEFRIAAIAADGGTVLTERVDIFRYPGKEVSLPVMGTFEVVDGKIAAWRDYFDMNQFMSQLS
ncbi:MAG TPA: limonene-1,2-epoxide hydrolase family protein [Acidimicrobiales bacterium]|nr:limonene-1,2-epoxide hydrolase family protein [Acidimicrobiales bacterium]